MRKVIFYGALKDQFEGFTLHAENDAILISGIIARYPEFRKAAIKNDAAFSFDENGDCHIAPKGQGSSATWILVSSIIGAISGVVGAAVAINQTYINKRNKKKQAREAESSLFEGVINSDVQGGPIPLAFGEVYCGSVVINNELEPY